MQLYKWPNAFQDRHFRNGTNYNWEEIERNYNAFEKSNKEIVENSLAAKEKAEEANLLSKNVQKQLDVLVVNGDSGPEAVQARTDANGKAYIDLRERMNTEQKQMGNVSELEWLPKSIVDSVKDLKKWMDQRGVNVRQPPYNAKGDGVTDDSDAILRAVAALPDGGILHFPIGVYKFTKQIKIDKRITLSGCGHSSDGKGATTLLKDGNFKGIWLFSNACKMRDMTVKGATFNDNDGIYITGGRATLTNVEVTNIGAHGIRIGNETADTDYNANLFYLNNVVVTACMGNGVHIHDERHKDLPNAGAGSISQLDVRGCKGDGLYLGSCIDVCLYNPVVQMCDGWGIRLGPDCKSAKFFGQYTEFNKAGEIWIEKGARRNYFFSQRDNQPLHVIKDEGDSTFLLGRDNNNNDMLAINKMQFSLFEISDTAISGRWRAYQTTTRDLKFELIGTSSNAVVDFSSPQITLKVNKLAFKSNQILDFISYIGTVNYGTISPNSQVDRTVNIAGITPGCALMINLDGTIPYGLTWSVFCNTNDVATIRVHNHTSGGIAMGNIATKIGVVKMF